MGPWCEDCIHCGRDYSKIEERFEYRYAGSVYFCKKHIHELCPEFEMLGGSNAT